jgi:hypothetical protein
MAGSTTIVKQTGGSGYKRTGVGSMGAGMYNATANQPGVNADWLTSFIRENLNPDLKDKQAELEDFESYKENTAATDAEQRAIDDAAFNALKIQREQENVSGTTIEMPRDVTKDAIISLGRKALTTASGKAIDMLAPVNKEPVYAGNETISSGNYEAIEPDQSLVPSAMEIEDAPAGVGPVGQTLIDTTGTDSTVVDTSSVNTANEQDLANKANQSLGVAETAFNNSPSVGAEADKITVAENNYKANPTDQNYQIYADAVNAGNLAVDQYNAKLDDYKQAAEIANIRNESAYYEPSDYLNPDGTPTNTGTFAQTETPSLGTTAQGMFSGANNIYSGIESLKSGNPVGALNIATGAVNLANVFDSATGALKPVLGNSLKGMGNTLGTVGGIVNIGTGLYDVFTGDTTQEKIKGGINAGVGATTLASEAGVLPASVSAPIGTIAAPLAIITAANSARNAWGGTNKDYREKTNRERFFDDPFSSVPTNTMGMVFGDKSEINRIPMQVSNQFSHYNAGPIQKAFNLDFKGGLKELVDAPQTSLESFGVSSSTANAVNTVLSGGLNKVLGTHLCSATISHAYLYPQEQQAMKKLRRYAFKKHRGWIRAYIKHGKKLVKEISKRECDLTEFYMTMRKLMIEPVVALCEEDMEKAYHLYKLITIELFNTYLPNFDIKEEF